MPLRYPNLSPTMPRSMLGSAALNRPQGRVVMPRAGRPTNPPTLMQAAGLEYGFGPQTFDPNIFGSAYGGMEVPSAQVGMTNPMGNSRAMEQAIDPLAQFNAPQLGTASPGGPPQLGTPYGNAPQLPSWGAPGWLYGLNGMNQWGR